MLLSSQFYRKGNCSQRGHMIHSWLHAWSGRAITLTLQDFRVCRFCHSTLSFHRWRQSMDKSPKAWGPYRSGISGTQSRAEHMWKEGETKADTWVGSSFHKTHISSFITLHSDLVRLNFQESIQEFIHAGKNNYYGDPVFTESIFVE